ncbi:MAG: fimbrillin family protein [Bacteroidales bacterium]|nr:fimbrillin family protein [Bacteroidales bacterium]
MKKLILICLAALSAGACVMEQMEAPAGKAGGKGLVFEGGFAPETRIAYGDAVNGIYPLQWTRGDMIGIFSYKASETSNKNIKGELYEDYIGENKGIFIPVDVIHEIPPEIEGGAPVEIVERIQYPQGSDEDFFVYYPFKDGAELVPDEESDAICFLSRLDKVQSQQELGDRIVGNNGFSAAFASVKAGSGKATFELQHKMAYICFKATSSEFSGYQLHSVQLYDAAKEASLCGSYSYNLATGTLKAAPGKSESSAKVVAAHHDWSRTPERNELCLTVFPGDYSAADMYVIVTFMNQAGETQTIPFKLQKKCRFPAASLTVLDLGDIGTADNRFPWFETHEVRSLVDMYAYGSENTYMAQHFIRKVSTERPKDHVVIDVKPRGDFSKVTEPKYYALLVPSEMGCTSIASNTRKLLCLNDSGNQFKREATPTHVVNADYTIDVWTLDTTAGTGTWGVVGLYDADYNLIWSYLVCTYLEGQPVGDVTYGPGMTVMDRWLGQENSNRRCAQLKTFVTDKTDTTRAISGVLPFFQWGRKDAFNWSNSGGAEGIYKSVLADDNTTIEDGIKNPTTHLGYSSGATSWDSHGDWHSEGIRTDLWGGYNDNGSEWYDPDATGHKTVFDPCPAGYRVPDAKVLKFVGDHAEIWESPNEHAYQVTDPASSSCYLNPESPFYKTSKGFSVLAVKDIFGEYDYWYFAGFSGNGDNYNSRTDNSKNKALETWSNAVSNADNRAFGRAAVLEYGYWSTQRLFNERHSAQRAYRYPVRCQKIDN